MCDFHEQHGETARGQRAHTFTCGNSKFIIDDRAINVPARSLDASVANMASSWAQSMGVDGRQTSKPAQSSTPWRTRWTLQTLKPSCFSTSTTFVITGMCVYNSICPVHVWRPPVRNVATPHPSAARRSTGRTWAVQQKVVIVTISLQFFLKPIHVLCEELHGINEATIGPKFKLLHHFTDTDQVFDV